MAGMFELFVDAESGYRFRLTAPDGTIMAVSKPFNTKSDAVEGIAAVREYAGMGLITDQCTTSPTDARAAARSDPGDKPDAPRLPKIDFHGRASAVRRPVSGPRWAGAIHGLS